MGVGLEMALRVRNGGIARHPFTGTIRPGDFMRIILVDRRPRRSLRLFCTAFFLTFVSTSALADGRCEQLEALARQYAGVALTSAQEQMKRRMVSWYKQNCGSRRSSHN